MSGQYLNESMLEMFIFETGQLIEQLEQSILSSEKSNCYTESAINEIFRIMHTIKGSSAMMMFEDISSLAHSMEDLFYLIREKKPKNLDFTKLSDLIFEGVDFIKVEMVKIKNGDSADGNSIHLIGSIKRFLADLKPDEIVPEPPEIDVNTGVLRQKQNINPEKAENTTLQNTFKAVVYFDDGCQMENIRAFSIINNLSKYTREVSYIPEDIIDNELTAEIIKREGFTIFLKTDSSYKEMHEFFMETIFLRDLELIQLDNENEMEKEINPLEKPDQGVNVQEIRDNQSAAIQQSIISVNIAKLDKLMDLVGEMVIAEAMVTRNPDLKGLELNNFQKAARQLHKITGEMQDIVMAIRMMPVSSTFLKMHRIVRDMCRKLGKEVQLELIGEETEVDKNIIEHISDPIMHLIRNAIDHGIEAPEDRKSSRKPLTGKITLEAQNAGSDVLISVKDDGKGLNREKILKRARENGLINKLENEISDEEIFNLILLPGFSTRDDVSEFSGRGVGLDVVIKNTEIIGGSVQVHSKEGAGTTVTLKIPLTLAIIDGMNIKVGASYYTIPTTSIKESFRPNQNEIITDPDNNEMIMVRGQCYPILRLHQYYNVKTHIWEISKGILIMVEHEKKIFCIFADELLGQQQVVVKSLPNYIKNTRKINGLTGCTLLGDGSISLILDTGGLVSLKH